MRAAAVVGTRNVRTTRPSTDARGDFTTRRWPSADTRYSVLKSAVSADGPAWGPIALRTRLFLRGHHTRSTVKQRTPATSIHAPRVRAGAEGYAPSRVRRLVPHSVRREAITQLARVPTRIPRQLNETLDTRQKRQVLGNMGDRKDVRCSTGGHGGLDEQQVKDAEVPGEPGAPTG